MRKAPCDAETSAIVTQRAPSNAHRDTNGSLRRLAATLPVTTIAANDAMKRIGGGARN